MIKCSICNNDTSNKEVCSECGNKMKTLIIKARKKWIQLKFNMEKTYGNG
jgi:rRNA maturation endonuclease Nob1